jgi:hypothetical protein
VGSGESGIEATESRSIEAQDECGGTKENSGDATKEMGAAQGEESQLTDHIPMGRLAPTVAKWFAGQAFSA